MPGAPDELSLSSLVEIGRGAVRERHWEEALRTWAAVRERFPDVPSGYIDQGIALRELGRLDEAEALLNAGMERFPSNQWAMIHHASIAARRRDWAEALRRWAVVRERFPGEPSGYVESGLALREMGRFDEADDALLEATSRFPTDFGAAVNYARVAASRKDWPEALRRWQLVRTGFPQAPEGYVGIGEALRAAERLEEAETAFTEAVQRFTTDYRALLRHAQLATDTQRWDVAADRWAQLAERFPDQRLPWERLTGAHLALGRAGAAVSALDRALAGQPDNEHLAALRARTAALVPVQFSGDLVEAGEAAVLGAPRRCITRIGPGRAYREGPSSGSFVQLSPREIDTGELEYFEVENAILFNIYGYYGLVELSDGRICSHGPRGAFNPYSRTLMRHYGDYYYKDLLDECFHKYKMHRIGGRCLLPYRIADTFYFQFMVESPQSVYDGLSLFPDATILLPGSDKFFDRMHPDVLRDAVTMVGARPADVRWLDEGIFQVDRLILRRNWMYGRFTYVDEMLRRLPVRSPSSERVVYISRGDARVRQISNEPELLRVIADVFPSCEVVETSKLTFAEQATLFRSSRVIIGPHGGGLTNLLFCKPGASIIEIAPKNSGRMFYHLSLLRNLEYLAYYIDYDAHFVKSFKIDTDQFRIALESVSHNMGEHVS